MKRVVFVLLCVALGAQLATANPAAKPHVDAGVKAYSAGDYETAIREFQRAHAIDPDATVLYAWAQANRLGGHCEDAVALYERYLQTKPTADQKLAAETGISLCEQQRPWPPKPGAATVTEPATTTPGPEQATEPATTTPMAPSPGTHDEPDEPRPWYADRIAGALTIGGAVALGTGVTFLVLAGRSEDAAERELRRADFVDLLDEATMRRRIGYAALGVGAVLVTAGVVRYVMKRTATTDVAVAVSGTSLLVQGRF